MEEELLAKFADTLTGELFSAGIGWLKEKALDTKVVQRLRERFGIGEEIEIGQHIFKSAIRKALRGIESVNKIDVKFISHEKNRDVFLTWLNTHNSSYTDDSFDWYPYAQNDTEIEIHKLFVARLAVTIQEEKKKSSHPLIVTVYNLQLVIIEYLKRNEQEHDQFAKEQRKQSEMLSALYSLQTANIEKQLDLLPPNELATLLAKLAPEKIKQVKESLTQFSMPTALEPTLLERVVASFIPLDASAYELAMKAIGEGRLDDAKRLLDEDIPKREQRIREMKTAFTEILTNEKRELAKSYTAKAQVAYYEIKYGEAVEWQKKACDVEPDNWKNWNFLTILNIEDGQYAKAIQSGEVSLSLVERCHNDKGKINVLNSLAGAYKNSSNFKLALECNRVALHMCELIHGKQDPYNISLLYNFGQTLKSFGDFANAMQAYEQALQLSKEIFGEFCAEYALGLNNISVLLLEQGEYIDSERLGLTALERTKIAFWDTHPNVAMCLSNLGSIYRETGRFDLAEKFTREALQVLLHNLAETHPLIAIVENNLATILQIANSDKYFDEIFHLYESVLLKRRSVLGNSHFDTSVSLNNFATLLMEKGKLIEAEPLLKEAMTISLELFGDLKSSTIVKTNNYAEILRLLKRYEEARTYYEGIINLSRKYDKIQKLDVAMTLNNYATLLRETNCFEEAEVALKECIDICDTTQIDHPNYVHSLESLAYLLHDMGRHEEGVPYYQRAQEMKARIKAANPKSFGENG